eukprot:4443251-Karenia_brevis.AAC.1
MLPCCLARCASRLAPCERPDARCSLSPERAPCTTACQRSTTLCDERSDGPANGAPLYCEDA